MPVHIESRRVAAIGASPLPLLLTFLFLLTLLPAARAADPAEAEAKLRSGQYAECLELTDKAINEDAEFAEVWRRLKIEAHLARGQYEEAKTTLGEALPRYSSSIQLRLLGHEVYRRNGDLPAAKQMLSDINRLVSSRSWWYTDPPDMIVQGRAALLLGADPKQVLQVIYDKVQTEQPSYRGTYLAMGELALNKHDYAEAARAFQAGLQRYPNDADLHFGLAMAFAPSDGEKTEAALEMCLEQNPNHIPALLTRADNLIDGEYYGEAEKQLAKVFEINPAHPEAWAYAAVLAHLENDAEGEADCRQRALKHWPTNPEVDHLIGQKLSQKYRFAEGAEYQRRALKFDPDYLPAKMQLSQDLLRLGHVEEGWKLARDVLENDAYNVVAYNLVTLQDSIAKFTTLENERFIVRMSQREAQIYGQQVLDLLDEAYEVLGEKYGLKPKQRVTVEIFPDQKDFAIRTFGLPGGAGYLGVCFGNVITANSPASQGNSPSNWQAVLWHEYCHVVTLQATRNRMPRWLSEGISVYEEKQRNDTWGQSMIPTYRQMITEGGLTPVGELSAAFLRAPSALHLQFAYYESSLVVEFIIQTAGLDALRNVLAELHDGVYINDALERHVGPMEQIEKDFEAYATSLAKELAPDANFDAPPQTAQRDEAALEAWLEEKPNNVPALMIAASRQIAAEQYDDAKKTLAKIIELFPTMTGGDSAYAMLAAVHRELEETEAEYKVLEKLASLDADAVPVFVRLMQIAGQREDWSAVLQHAERALAVNPLLAEPHRWLARGAEYTNDHGRAIRAYTTLLVMDPADPAQIHYKLANSLHTLGDAKAKRHALLAIEEAPRYRAAHQLLLKIRQEETKQTPETEKSPDTSPDRQGGVESNAAADKVKSK